MRNTIPVAVLPHFINGFSLKAFGASAFLEGLLGGSADNDHVLVLIQLTGGNDGLNMLIPLDEYSDYYNARSNIAIPENKVLGLNGTGKAGLHTAMTGLQQLYNNGKVNLIQSVGYPSPNFSHFRATDIWLTGADSGQVLASGWAGRYLDYQFPNYPSGYPNPGMTDPLAIQIGGVVSTAFQGPSANMGMAVTNPDKFYNLINGVLDPAPGTPGGKELTYIRGIARQTDLYGKSIMAAAAKVTSQYPGYPANNSLAQQLKIVARLVAGGLKTKLYLVGMGGFDNHSNQVNTGDTATGAHANLLGELSDAISAFMADLQLQHADERVIGMTFSEFGRRIKSNASVGTDHGAAAPMIVFGNSVQSGVLGTNPVLPTNAKVADNIPMQYDFRSVYASLLNEWFCVPDANLSGILLRNYQLLPLVKDAACASPGSIGQVNQAAANTLISNYPNPFSMTTTITYKTIGGHTMVQIFDTMGRMIAVPVDKTLPPGVYTFPYSGSALADGVYYARFQNGAVQQVRLMLKVK